MSVKKCFTQFKKVISGFISIFFLLLISCSSVKTEYNLSGEWKFKMDDQDKGLIEQWYSQKLMDTIYLPGSMSINGKGKPVGYDTQWTANIWVQNGKKWFENSNYKPYLSEEEFLFPFWLIPEKYYTGAAWYQKEINLPSDWENKRIELVLERCHWETMVWVDKNYVGTQNSLSTAHRYDLTKFLSPGKHIITICVDNRVKDIQVGYDAHSVSDNTQSNWNGIVGEIKLLKKDLISISGVQIFPDLDKKKAVIHVAIMNLSGENHKLEINLKAKGNSEVPSQRLKQIKKNALVKTGLDTLVVDYPLGDQILLWDEFNPNLYTLEVEIKAGKYRDSFQETFGMRSFQAGANRFYINGRPLFLRGTLECAIFLETGYPPTDEASWEKIIHVCKSYGLNHLRFHSWCPPEAAFRAADKAGFYFQIECSTWATIGDGEPIDDWIYHESNRIVSEYGNHPSFVMMAYGNEPHGKNHKAYLKRFVKYWKNRDNRRIYTSGAGWPAIPENQYHNLPQPRIQRWGEELNSIINKEPPSTDYDWGKRIEQYDRPVVSHEIGQWCAYPNLKEVEKYDGVLKPTNFEIFKRSLTAHNLAHLADSFFIASGKLQVLCYKADIEAALRTRGLAGFQLLGLNDFPGQGTALVGVLDPFWEEKGYVTADEFRRFCNETVPLARFEKRIFTSDETVKIDVEVAHFGEKKLFSVLPKWKILNSNGVNILEGQFSPCDLKWDNGIKLGSINKKFSVNSAQKFTLVVDVAGFSNSWDFWVYPAKLPEVEGSVFVTQTLNHKARMILRQGGKVLLTIKEGSIKNEKGGDIGIGFSSIFWNTAWTNGQKPHTLGILCNPYHPALSHFPTEFHSNWQWWDAMSHSNAILLESFSNSPDPIVRVIDDWVTNRNLALIFEAKVGNGKLLVCGIDLLSDIGHRPEARQLLYSLKKYMSGEKFEPGVSLNEEEIFDLFQ